MIELDARLLALRVHARAWGTDLRAIGMDLDRDPDAMFKFLDLPVAEYLSTASYSRQFADHPLVVGRRRYYLDSVLEQVVFFEELAYGDAGALLALPGAPVAGPLVQILGDSEQQESFFSRLADRTTWTFFASAEPTRGMGTGGMTSELVQVRDGFELTGTQQHVGNAPRAQVGVVFAGCRSEPLGVRAVLVETSVPGLTAVPLQTVGLRGAMLGAITMESVAIPADHLLGRHVSVTSRGTASWMQVFNRLCPRVSAMGLGIAKAAHDYVLAHRHALREDEKARLEDLRRQITAARQLNYHAAVMVDADPTDGRLAAAVKSRVTRLAEGVTRAALEFFGPGARFDHPLLDKLVRDGGDLNYMQGTGNMRKHIVSEDLIRRQVERGSVAVP